MPGARAGLGFPGRLRLLVDRHHGSVRAAAKALGMTHPGLLALLNGSSSPRASTLNRIAERYGVSRDWLMAGEGKGPAESGLPTSDAWDQWCAVVRGLSLSLDGKTVLSLCPMLADVSIRFVTPAIMRSQAGSGLDESELRLHAMGGAVREAEEAELLAWTRLFRRWIEVTSPAEVGQAVEKNLDLFRSRFGPVDEASLAWALLRQSFELDLPGPDIEIVIKSDRTSRLGTTGEPRTRKPKARG